MTDPYTVTGIALCFIVGLIITGILLHDLHKDHRPAPEQCDGTDSGLDAGLNTDLWSGWEEDEADYEEEYAIITDEDLIYFQEDEPTLPSFPAAKEVKDPS